MAEIEFCGEKFTIADTVNEFALMEFADAAENVEANTMGALSSVFRLLQDTIAPEDWQRFKLCARKNRADSQTLMPVVFAVFEQATDRPTGQPAVSSGGQEVTQLTSVSKPADLAMERLEGRPDMQLALMRTRRSA